MFNGLIIASANNFSQGSADKNGNNPVLLNVVAGRCPNRNILAGTVAQNNEIEVGKTYLFQVRETEPSEEYGRQFSYQKLKEVTAMEIISATKDLGAAVIFDAGVAETTPAAASVDNAEAGM